MESGQIMVLIASDLLQQSAIWEKRG